MYIAVSATHRTWD